MSNWNFGYIETLNLKGLQKKAIETGNRINLIYYFKNDKGLKNIKEEEKSDYIFNFNNCKSYNGDIENFVKDSDFLVHSGNKHFLGSAGKEFISLAKKYNKPLINIHSPKIYALETNRSFGKKIASSFGINAMPNIESLNKDVLKAFIKKHKDVVIKTNNSSLHTYIPSSMKEALDIIEYDLIGYLKNKSCILEKRIKGKELCTGFYFNGKDIVGNCIFYNQEYKQLFDGDKSNVLTGEVGTVFKIESFNKATPYVKKVINNLKEFLVKNNYKGFIDMNFIKDSNKEPVLMEFTCREGYPTQCILPFVTPNIVDFYATVAGLNEDIKIKEGYYCCTCLNTGTSCSQFLSSRTNSGFPIYGMDKNCLPMDSNYTKDGKVIYHNFYDRPAYIVGYNRSSLEKARAVCLKSASKIVSFGLAYRKDIGYNWIEPNKFFI